MDSGTSGSPEWSPPHDRTLEGRPSGGEPSGPPERHDLKVMRAALVSAPTVPASTTITDAISSMKIDCGCSVGVVEQGRLVGTLSKDDILQRVVATGLDPALTPVRDAMTTPPLTVAVESEVEDAIQLMTSKRQCFMPVVNDDGAVKGWLTVCHSLEGNVEMLSEQLDTFAAMLGADGPGG